MEALRHILLSGLVNCRSFRFELTYYEVDQNCHPCDDYRLSDHDTVALILAVIADTDLPVESFHIPNFSSINNGSIDMSRIDCL